VTENVIFDTLILCVCSLFCIAFLYFYWVQIPSSITLLYLNVRLSHNKVLPVITFLRTYMFVASGEI